MSAPRVPAGWTRAMRDIVWEDFRAALAEEPSIGLGFNYPVSDDGFDDPHQTALTALSAAGFLSCSAFDDAGADYYWASTDARLRAWAAVGAPVIAPRPEGEPAPLWEWVREAMAPPREVRPYTVRDGWWSFDYGYHGASLVPWGQGWCAEVFVHGDGVPLARCATPAELRTQLDRLATMRTLAELRAALDKLAAEVKL